MEVLSTNPQSENSMEFMDRRSGRDRRTVPRYPISVDVEWEGASPRKVGTLSDISTNGCFVLTAGPVDDGELVRLFLPLSDGMKVQVLAVVANHVMEIGFGAKFFDVSPAQHEFITSFVALHGEFAE
jgi:hypothetical protein